MPGRFQESSDADLARQAQAGVLTAFEELVGRYEGRVLRFLRQITRNRQDAEDLTQTAFIAAWRSLSRYDPQRPLAAWLLTIARRQAISHARAARWTVPLPEDLCAVAASAPADGSGEELWDVARRELKPDQFTALWLRYAEELSVRETATVMGKTAVHVRVLLHRGRQAMLTALTRRHARSRVSARNSAMGTGSGVTGAGPEEC